MSKKVIVTSRNPVKIEAVRSGFEQAFDDQLEYEGIAVESGVPDQPMSDEETRAGAVNRIKRAMLQAPDAAFYVGIEGGVEPTTNGLTAFAWVVVSDGKKWGESRSTTFVLPPRVAELVYQGFELGEADDIVFGRSNSKQQNGAVGLLTNDALTRARLYHQAVLLACIPFINPELYSGNE